MLAATGHITTDNRPAATSVDGLARVISPSCTPIVVAATMNGSDVACNSRATMARRVPMSGRYSGAG